MTDRDRSRRDDVVARNQATRAVNRAQRSQARQVPEGGRVPPLPAFALPLLRRYRPSMVLPPSPSGGGSPRTVQPLPAVGGPVALPTPIGVVPPGTGGWQPPRVQPSPPTPAPGFGDFGLPQPMPQPPQPFAGPLPTAPPLQVVPGQLTLQDLLTVLAQSNPKFGGGAGGPQIGPPGMPTS